MPEGPQGQTDALASKFKALAEANLMAQGANNRAILVLTLGPQTIDVAKQINELWTKQFALNVEFNLHCQREIQNAQGS